MAKLVRYADQLDHQYQTHFAGHPRFSRDPTLLRRMAAQARQYIGEHPGGKPSSDGRTRLINQIELYESEAKSIDTIQSSSSEDFLGHEYRSWLDLIFARYRRNFAARSRSDRPLNLLSGLKSEVVSLIEQLGKLSVREPSEVADEAMKVAHAHRDLFETEFEAIAVLRRDGDTSQRTSLLANDANRLFGDWSDFFSNKARLSRRIKRLGDMIEHLGWIDEQMALLESEGDPEGLNQKNRSICEQRLAFYQDEIEQIRKARSDASFDEIVLTLGEAANAMFAKYRETFAGKDRQTVPLDTLNVICEELYDLAAQMNELDRVRSNDANQQNLATVLDQLRLFQREYDSIRKVQEAS